MGVGWADLSLALGVVGPPTKRSHICTCGLVQWVMPDRLCQGLHFSPEISVLSVTGRVVHVSDLKDSSASGGILSGPGFSSTLRTACHCS